MLPRSRMLSPFQRDRIHVPFNRDVRDSINMADDASEMDVEVKSESESDDEEEKEMNDDAEKNEEKEIYLPGKKFAEDETLVYDPTAYYMYHRAATGAPCLSFDIIPDKLGEQRDEFPLTCYVAAGTQASKGKPNFLLVMKLQNLTEEEKQDGDESDDESDDDDPPELDIIPIPHAGAVNRIRVTVVNDVSLAATWAETGTVYIYDFSAELNMVDDQNEVTNYVSTKNSVVQAFSGHQTEGFALDWSPNVKGRLASGDCDGFIHVLEPRESQWDISKAPYTGHTGSVEDIQWSPNEDSVFASCSTDHTIRAWDVRAKPSSACMLTVSEAHTHDVNVIHWNRKEPFIASGGDDGVIKIWDLRLLKDKKPVVVFGHHLQPITSIEWNPNDSSVFAASGADDQITIWDLAVEPEEGASDDLPIPPQLLFIHQGQSDIKELHWHPQLPGVIISTAQSDFNIFRAISV